MYILNLEDNIFKYNDICKTIKRGHFKDINKEITGE